MTITIKTKWLRIFKQVLALSLSLIMAPYVCAADSSLNKQFKSAGKYPLGKWPLLASYKDSECLDVDDDKLDFMPFAAGRKHSVKSRFALASFGGKLFVNPQVHKGWQSISFSIDTATQRVVESGVSCFQVMDIEIKAWPKKYKKLYIVVDKAVRYEIPIVLLAEEG